MKESKPLANLGVASRCCDEAMVAGDPTRIVLISCTTQSGQELQERLLALKANAIACLLQAPDVPEDWSSQATDIVIVEVAANCTDSFAQLGRILSVEPWAHPVFLVSEDTSAEAFALRSIGSHYILSQHNFIPWFKRAIGPLAETSRAKRILTEAKRMIPLPPTMDDGCADPLSLPQAEELFRETYLKALLAKCSTRKEVARAAGIPYTTLRSMLEKLRL